jgi:hypothetical protein
MLYALDGARHILAVLCEVSYHDRGIGSGGPTAWPPRSLDLTPLDFYVWGHLNIILCAVPVDNEEALHHRTVDAYQTIRNYPGIFEMGDVMRRALNLMEVILSTYYKSTLSVIIHKLNVSAHMLIWTFFLLLVRGTLAKILSSPFNYTL